jgi:hypothetical protein
VPVRGLNPSDGENAIPKVTARGAGLGRTIGDGDGDGDGVTGIYG